MKILILISAISFFTYSVWNEGCKISPIEKHSFNQPTQIVTETVANTINAGFSIDLVKLGDSRDQVFKIFPKKAKYDEEYDYNGIITTCRFNEIHWLELEAQGSNGIYFYLKDGLVFQIASSSPNFKTSEGLSIFA